MMRTQTLRILSPFFILLILASCIPAEGLPLPSMEIPLRDFSVTRPAATLTPPPAPTQKISTARPTSPTSAAGWPTSTPHPYSLWIESSVPGVLRTMSVSWNVSPADSFSAADLRLGLSSGDDENPSMWVYALVTPFPTVLDGVTLEELKAAWNDPSAGPFPDSPIWMAESTLAAFTALWGEASPGSVDSVPEDELLDTLWENQPAWGIVPFEALDPRLKVLTVDGQSPIRNDFVESEYPLVASFALTGTPAASFDMPLKNRDPDKLSVVLLTGVTALVRATAVRMEIAGLDYPAWNIGELLEAADITHISNEIPFYTGCPYPDPRQEGLVFCSNPKYIELLELVGTDVVELTGNHFQDYGSPATLQTLELYRERDWPYYGGGADLSEAQQAATLEHHGNRFAFIGCNAAGPAMAWATEDQPGAAPCEDYEWMKSEISRLAEQGYIVIATFQYFEYYEREPTPQHVSDFRAIAEAGATIVSGSQAHIPQAMEFRQRSFIHYGLGNLFFDQMDGPSRREFLDRHTFYDGRYISTELVTAMLEDYARPRPMRAEERQAILELIFSASGW